MTKTIRWSDNPTAATEEAVKLLEAGGAAIVSPTKVGYIIITTDAQGLERKFDLKQRAKRKPAVVLCTSIEQLKQLAQTNETIEKLYQSCYDQNILLGCILPWKPEAIEKYVPEDARSLVHDPRVTSCFVVRFGEPSERIVKEIWEKQGKLVFASSANPSGQGNRGRLEGVGERILSGVDLAIDADDYVAAQQPDKDEFTRYEQGVMVSMVDDQAQLIDVPVVIRKGLAIDKILLELTKLYNSFDYRHGQYY